MTRTHVLVIAVCLMWSAGCARQFVDLPEGAAAHKVEGSDLVVGRYKVIEASADCLYSIVSDLERWSSWDPHISQTRWITGQGFEQGHVFFQDPKDYQVQATVERATPGELIRWRGRDVDGGGPVGTHSWMFKPLSPGRTLVINIESFEAWYIRPLGWFTDLGIGEQFEHTLDGLARQAQRRCSSQ